MIVSRKRLIFVLLGVVTAVAVVALLAPTRIRAIATAVPGRGMGLLVTNGTTKDFAFYFYLQERTESGWVDVPNQPEGAGVLQFFVKGRAEYLEMELPVKTGVYRFMCGYEPLSGTPQSLLVFNRLYGLKLPGVLGTGYRYLLDRFRPWPKNFFSNALELEAKPNEMPPRAEQSDGMAGLGR